LGTGIFSSAKEAIDLCSKTEKYISHDRKNHKVYSELFYKYKRMKALYDQYRQ
jgi:hypothetical protein